MNQHGNRALEIFQGVGRNQVFLNNFDGAENAADPNAIFVNVYEQNFWNQNQNCADVQPADGICDQPYNFPNRNDPHPRKNRIQWELVRNLCAPVQGREESLKPVEGDSDAKPGGEDNKPEEESPEGLNPADLNVILLLEQLRQQAHTTQKMGIKELWLPSQ